MPNGKHPSPAVEPAGSLIEVLYLDNFRGFAKTFIPIRPVTFFVGENSTGKSSVLSVLHLVRDYSFWSEPDFDTQNQHLGGFDDLRTSGSRRPTFVIGSVRWQRTYEGTLEPATIVASFGNNEGLPRCTKISFAVNARALTVMEESGGFYARRSILDTASKRQVDEFSLKEAVELHDSTDAGKATRLDIQRSGPTSGVFLFHLLGVADRMLSKATSTEDLPYADFPPIYQFVGSSSNAVWLAPVRTKPRRTYDGTKKAFSAEGDHTPYLLKSQLARKALAANFKTLLARLGRESHLFDGIGVRSFGRGNAAPFEVHVDVGGVGLSLSNVGYGVSQVLPILVEILARSKNTTFHIQQPEVHLHPRAQAALGELIYLLAADEEKRFVIETHSDFLIDRYRSMIREHGNKGYAANTSLLFFRRERGHNFAEELILSPEGEYPIDQPSSFRDFFIKEQLRSLAV